MRHRGGGLGHRPLAPDRFDERHDGNATRRLRTRIRVADDDKDIHARGLRQLHHATDGLALERLRVEVALAGDHQVGGLDQILEPEPFGNHVESGDKLRSDGREAAGETARRSGAGQIADVDAVIGDERVGEAFEPPLQQFDLLGRRALLFREVGRGADERGRDIARDHNIDAAQARLRSDRAQCAQAAIGGRRSADADDDPPRTGLDGGEHEFAGPECRRVECVVGFWPTRDRQTRRSGHLDDGGVILEAPRGVDRASQRTRHAGRAVATAEYGQRSLATVGDGYGVTLPPRGAGAARDRIGYLRRCCGAAELVGGGYQTWHEGYVRKAVAPLVVVSNRGPLAFTRGDDGKLAAKRGAGGLVATLGSALTDRDAVWVSAAISEDDRDAAAQGLTEADGFTWRALVVPDEEYRMFYDVVSNATLWFMHHALFDLPRRPRIDRHWREAWAAYRAVNRAFADAVCDEADHGATVLVHDYHVALVGARLAAARPDLRAVHFNHTPFCSPAGLRVLPADVTHELMSGLAGFTACGFHSQRWADDFSACAREVLGAAPPTFVAPAATDHDDIARVAASDECAREFNELNERIGDRHFICRVDRIELSKNLLRGFLAFDDLLTTRPEWRGRVVFGAFVYPSRESLAEYVAYHQEVESLANRINERWATSDWTPIIVDTDDYFPRSCAALRRYDVLLVNPVRDGLNLVAKEGSLLNERDGVLALSREAGVWDELKEAALDVNPFDVAGTADVLAEALAMDGPERARRSALLCEAAARRTPRDWLEDQLRATRIR